LTGLEIKSLARSARAVLREAVASRGSSLRDLSYRDLDGEIGSYQQRHAVYEQGRRAVSTLPGPCRAAQDWCALGLQCAVAVKL